MIGQYLGAGSAVTAGFYKLDGNADDSSGNARNGTPVNVSWTGGKNGSGSASFDGATSVISWIPNFGITSSFSATCLARSSNWLGSTGWFAFFWIENQSQPPFTGWAPSWGVYASGWVLRMYLNKSYVIGVWTSSALPLQNDTWYKFGVSYDGTSLSFYLNWNPASNTTSSQTFLTNNTMAIGRDGLTTAWMNWQIDELVIEKGAVWTAAKFKKDFTYSKGAFVTI